MSETEIQTSIDIIQNQLKKPIKIGYEKCKKIRKSIQKHRLKIINDSQRLIDETDPQLTEEGVQKITKKGKIYFRSLKAFNPFLHFLNDHFTKLKIPEDDLQLTSSELNLFIRNLSRLYNDTIKEKAIADGVMGLDFMLKRRGIYGALGKVNSELGNLRDLQKEEYAIIKALEDLHSLQRDVENIKQKIETLTNEVRENKSQLKSTQELLEEEEKKKQNFLEDPLISNSRQRGIRITELEIEIGTHLNSFKKVFKKYAREVQRGSVFGEFGLVNAALAYEENPVKRFLKEEEGNPEISALVEELIKIGEKSLHLKQKNINNLTRILKKIRQGGLDPKRNEWRELHNKKTQDETSIEFKNKTSDLESCEKKIEEVQNTISDYEENISLKERELTNLSESLDERKERSLKIKSETLNWS
jgi:peptidoglycan hydrolase CwlO-like protein